MNLHKVNYIGQVRKEYWSTIYRGSWLNGIFNIFLVHQGPRSPTIHCNNGKKKKRFACFRNQNIWKSIFQNFIGTTKVESHLRRDISLCLSNHVDNTKCYRVKYLVVPQYSMSASFINATLQIHQEHVWEIYISIKHIAEKKNNLVAGLDTRCPKSQTLYRKGSVW